MGASSSSAAAKEEAEATMVLYDAVLVSYAVALAHYALEFGLYGAVEGRSLVVTVCIDGGGLVWMLGARGGVVRFLGAGMGKRS
jgi:hypothetical protein